MFFLCGFSGLFCLAKVGGISCIGAEYHVLVRNIILGRHGSVSLCRVEQENKMAATYNVLAFKR